ncbi:MAG: UDP-N-acetylmuramoyl-tripeptide--D-alanyl-D-alanine ligase [Patescibacteria group bacterium]|nr:UDP-N-acetylmuramoyl-tripeptide--D-alanyl-D-alanine ligase [Patescibacteria group bacterium]
MSKKVLQSILRYLARKILHRYQPKVIGITGSVGKTSTKEAIFTVMSSHYKCRRNQKNYNNEIGVPLTIIGRESGRKNPLAWLGVFLYGWRLIYGPRVDYPQILILEMGADHPGDIQYLVKFTRPFVGVVTAVGPVHLEYFSKIERIAQEKSHLIKSLPTAGWAVLNNDDDLVIPMREKTSAQVVTYGFSEEAGIRAFDIRLSEDQTKEATPGLSFKVKFHGSTFPVFLPHAIGRHQIYAAIAALAVGSGFNLNAVEMSERIKGFRPPAGRMNLIAGIKKTLIIDDSYNSSPTAAVAALKTLEELPARGAKYAVLGDMAELGSYTEQGHREVGEMAVSCVNYLVTVGEKAKIIAEAAQAQGFPKEEIYSFDYAEPAGKFLEDRIKPGDLILVKGSQVARLEKVVKELMAEPMRASELLVRQGPEWQNN